VNDFIKPGNESLKLPDFNLFNIGASYKIKLKNQSQYFTLGVNVYNLFDTTYIQDGATNIKTKELGDFTTTTTGGVTTTAQQKYDAYQATLYKGLDPTNRVFFGFGRTWSTTLSFNF